LRIACTTIPITAACMTMVLGVPMTSDDSVGDRSRTLAPDQ
jgi:hypothetical protein